MGTFQNEDSSGNRTPTTDPKDAVFSVPYAYALVGSVADLPIQIPLKAGHWSLVAVATDEAGLKAVSPSVTVSVTVTSAIRQENRFRRKIKARGLDYQVQGRKLKSPTP